jgi:electron transport complex protein RnfD
VNASARPARSLAARNLWLLAALLPGLLLQVRDDHGLPLRLLLALAAALAFEALSLLLRRQPLLPYLREGSAFVHAAILVAWLPTLESPRLLATVFVALVLARQAFGGLGRNLFHPVAAGVAFAQLAWLAPLPSTSAEHWLPFAWLLGGLVLVGLRIVRWQAPVFLLAGMCLLSNPLGDPRWLLAAFFVAGDALTTPQGARARALAAAGAGLAAGLGGVATLPFALLAMNAAAPLLDAWLDRGRPQAQRA